MAAPVLRGSTPTGRFGGRAPIVTQRDEDTEPAAAQTVEYVCPQSHTQSLRFSVHADEIPDTWQCRQCPKDSHRVGVPASSGGPSLDEPAYPGAWYSLRHLQTVKGRRTPDEQSALLEERLASLRQQRRLLAS
jgi:ribosomal protein L37AE/L43A